MPSYTRDTATLLANTKGRNKNVQRDTALRNQAAGNLQPARASRKATSCAGTSNHVHALTHALL